MKDFFSFTTVLAFAILIIAVPRGAVMGDTYDPNAENNYEDSYVPCGTKDIQTITKTVNPTTKAVTKTVTGTDASPMPDGVVDNPCKFADIITLAKRLIAGWIGAGVLFAALGFSYAGFLYITAMGSEEKISHAHSIFTKTMWGFVFMLSAWLIAYTLESVFLRPSFIQKNSFLQAPKP